MGTLSISEFAAHVHGSSLPRAPALRTQVVEIGAESAASLPFVSGAQIVTVTSDVPVHIAFGQSPVASFDDTYLPANTPRDFAVSHSDQVAVIERPIPLERAGAFALLAVIADPAAAKERLAEIAGHEAVLAKKIEQHKRLAAKIDKDARAFDEAAKSRIAELSEAERIHAGRAAELRAAELRAAKAVERQECAEAQLAELTKEIAAKQHDLTELTEQLAALRRRFAA
jgi:hypothetical protein